MQKIVFLFACLACTAHGRQVQRPVEDQSQDPSQVLAALLLAANEAAAFNPSAAGALPRAGNGVPTASRPVSVDQMNSALAQTPEEALRSSILNMNIVTQRDEDGNPVVDYRVSDPIYYITLFVVYTLIGVLIAR
mmetsp:Transcript_144857/g.263137  ORF Transcript_144857/g.263137 Transcript_144857/m.263137 type:complete len:135 (-) Transcript_144857:182-586(-)